MQAPGRVVIVGGSLAGATVATSLREAGHEGDVTLVGEEREAAYERPPLSKGVLRGEQTLEDAHVKPPSFYTQAGIDARWGVRADGLDLDGRRVRLDTGEDLAFDHLVVATGGRAKRPPIPGIGLEGVHTLRTYRDALAIRERTGSRAVVVGMGFIGSEVAASLRSLGVEVVAIEAGETPLAGVLGPEVGRVVEGIHRDHGVTMLLRESVDRFEGSASVEAVVTSTGRRIEADLVVVGLGMQPNVELLEGTPVEVANGVIVDERGRTTVPGVYAAGDVANRWDRIARRRVRLEHWTNAVKQGEVVARTILGQAPPEAAVPFFWSELYDEELQYYGVGEPWDRVVIRGALEAGDLLALYTSRDRLVAAASFGRTPELKVAKGLIAARATIASDGVLDRGEADVVATAGR